MGDAERKARAETREAAELVDELVRLLSEHLKTTEERFRGQLLDIRREAEVSLYEFAARRDAVANELVNSEKKLTKYSRKLTKKNPDTEKLSDELLQLADEIGRMKLEFSAHREKYETSMNSWLRFTEVVDDIVTYLHRQSTEWENLARDIGLVYQGICETSIPASFDELNKRILEDGFTILLAAGRRDQSDVIAFEQQLNDLLEQVDDEDDPADDAQ